MYIYMCTEREKERYTCILYIYIYMYTIIKNYTPDWGGAVAPTSTKADIG